MALQIVKFAWVDVAAMTRVVVPPLQSMGHKGSGGRVGVIGGSQDYCGAPFYSAVSALKFGADLSWIYCSQSAAIPIKSYSPELMVTPFYEDAATLQADPLDDDYENEVNKAVNAVSGSFPRLHSLVVGPGLGRNLNVMNITAKIIRRAREKNLPLVIDADGLWLVTQDLQAIMGYSRCILTPNQMEFERLVTATVDYLTNRASSTSSSTTLYNEDFTRSLLAELKTPPLEGSSESSEDGCAAEWAPHVRDARRVHALSAALGGVTVLRKGRADIIASSLGNALRRRSAATDTADCSSGCDSGGDSGGDSGSANSSSSVEEDRVFVLAERGSPRRCGGLGDILSGTTATALHWALQRAAQLPPLHRVPLSEPANSVQIHLFPYPRLPSGATDTVEGDAAASECAAAGECAAADTLTPADLQEQETQQQVRNAALHACIFASVVSKKASEVAFAEKGRSMTAPDVIEKIGAAFQIIHPQG